jgi:uncharacterized protein (DUF849 family)
VRLQACLNGVRRPEEVPDLPVTPEQLARAAVEVIAAGADGVHLHPKTPDGADSLEPSVVEAAVAAVRAAVPGIEVGVTTGLWAASDPSARERLVRGWSGLDARPDVASVNWHEDGVPRLAELLLDGGIGVEAGIWTVDAARSFADWPRRHQVTRVLVEATALEPARAVRDAREIAAVLVGGAPLLVHGQDAAAWPVLGWAATAGHAVRIGLEDALALPDGSPAAGNAALVAAAAEVLAMTASSRPWERNER